MRKEKVKFKDLKPGIKTNTYCWQEVFSNFMGDKIARHTRVEIIDVDTKNKTVLIQYLLGSHMEKLSMSDFDKLKLFRHKFSKKA